MTTPPPLEPVQLGAYFALMDVAGLLRHAVEQQLREAGDLSYVQFQLLARLGLDTPSGSARMTDLADGVVYSRSAITYQAGLLEQAGLVERGPSPDDERVVLREHHRGGSRPAGPGAAGTRRGPERPAVRAAHARGHRRARRPAHAGARAPALGPAAVGPPPPPGRYGLTARVIGAGAHP